MNKTEILSFLEANKNKKVDSILEELTNQLASLNTRNNSRTFRTDENNKVRYIYCWYHKQWEDLTKVEYGLKKSSSTGYNTMCKIGVKEWTRQQRQLKELAGECLKLVETGKLKFDELSDYKARREQEIKTINEKTRPEAADIE